MGLKSCLRGNLSRSRTDFTPSFSILSRGHSTTSSPSSSSSSTSSSSSSSSSSAVASPAQQSSPVRPQFPSPSGFSRAKHGAFFQSAPRLGNQWLDDPVLPRYLERYVPSSMYGEIELDMRAFGDRVAGELADLHLQCEVNPPRLNQFDAWGRRVDELVTCDAWKRMKRVSAEEGLIAIAYEKKYGRWSRLYQIGKSYLFSPSSGLYSCPLSMTDGAAMIIGASNNLSPGGTDLSPAFENLTSRDPAKFWTSGQWMTERGGGSDVGSGCETRAFRQPDGSYRLHGFKWFSSATDSNMAMTLARIVNEDGDVEQGSRGLSMFYLEVNAEGGGLNNMEVVRLKNKLGTRQLPTAELLLDGTVAQLASEPGRGIAAISPMLTVTRLHNSLAAASTMRRIVNVAKDYARRRTAFGKAIADHPLHAQTLARLEVETRAATLLVLEVARHLGTLDSFATDDEIDESERRKADLLLRILTPLMKLYTAKQSIACVSEGLESLGGQGYVEDTGYPAYLRDAQVLSIWEGTTNVLSLDLLRAMTKTRGKAVEAFFAEVAAKTENIDNHAMAEAVDSLRDAAKDVAQFLVATQNDSSTLQVASRDLSYSLARLFMGALMVEFASHTGRDVDAEIASRWCVGRELSLVATRSRGKAYDPGAKGYDRYITMDGLDGKFWNG